jgi:hypothetical protein
VMSLSEREPGFASFLRDLIHPSTSSNSTFSIVEWLGLRAIASAGLKLVLRAQPNSCSIDS